VVGSNGNTAPISPKASATSPQVVNSPLCKIFAMDEDVPTFRLVELC